MNNVREPCCDICHTGADWKRQIDSASLDACKRLSLKHARKPVKVFAGHALPKLRAVR